MICMHRVKPVVCKRIPTFQKELPKNLRIIRSCSFPLSTELVWQASLKKTEVKLELSTGVIMVKKGIRDGICHAANRYVKVNNKSMADYYSSTESSYLMYGDVSNLYGQTMRQRLPVDG